MAQSPLGDQNGLHLRLSGRLTSLKLISIVVAANWYVRLLSHALV